MLRAETAEPERTVPGLEWSFHTRTSHKQIICMPRTAPLWAHQSTIAFRDDFTFLLANFSYLLATICVQSSCIFAGAETPGWFVCLVATAFDADATFALAFEDAIQTASREGVSCTSKPAFVRSLHVTNRKCLRHGTAIRSV
jgi:hypothetical protein